MFSSENTFDEQSGLLQSGKRYKRYFGSYSQVQNTEYPPVNPTDSEPEETPSVGNPPITPEQRPIIPENPSQSESNPILSIPVAGQYTLVSSPPRSAMAHMNDDIKISIFKGTGSEDPEQFWFLCEAVWTAKSIIDENTRRAQLITSFRDQDFTWFMKFSSTQNYILADIKKSMIKEFNKPKSESQCITELKEIQQKIGESVWDFDQRFKVLLDQVSFTIGPEQHKEWFIAALLPHIRTPLV